MKKSTETPSKLSEIKQERIGAYSINKYEVETNKNLRRDSQGESSSVYDELLKFKNELQSARGEVKRKWDGFTSNLDYKQERNGYLGRNSSHLMT